MKKSVVLIAGALTGIDRTGVALAKRGTKVVIVGRRDESAKALVLRVPSEITVS